MFLKRYCKYIFQLNIDQANIELLVWLSENKLFLLGAERAEA